MKRVKILIGKVDRAFSEKLKELSDEVEVVMESVSLEWIKENANTAELLFLDRIPPAGFRNLKVKGVVVAPRYTRRKEFLAARSGARGFITNDITKPTLLNVIKHISSGEIWMSRLTIARVFEEYSRTLSNGKLR